MSYTTIDLVRNHIGGAVIPPIVVRNEWLRLAGLDKTYLSKQMIIFGSEIVKGITDYRPSREEVVFDQDNRARLARQPIAAETVVVADNGSLRRIFSENIDYVVDYYQGVINRIETGAIPAQARVVVWYLPYRVYRAGTDYRIDYEKGTIQRLADGQIQSGQNLLIDYQADAASISDELIAAAIDEAGGLMQSHLDPTRIDSADARLTIAHTFLAVSIICRMRSIATAVSDNRTAKGGIWTELAEQYRTDAFRLLDGFSREKIGDFGGGRRA